MIVIDPCETTVVYSHFVCHGLVVLPVLYVLVFVIAMFSMAFGPALNATLPLNVKKTSSRGSMRTQALRIYRDNPRPSAQRHIDRDRA